MKNKMIRVGLTHGDFNGVGCEVILKAFEDPAMLEICTPVLFGSQKALAHYRSALGFHDFHYNMVRDAADAVDGAFNVVDVVADREVEVTPGVATEMSALAALAALDAASTALEEGTIDVVVTAPINKEGMKLTEFPHTGHTEFFEARFGQERDKALMVLCSDDLRVALATVHEPLAAVPTLLDKEMIVEKLRLFNITLRKDFGFERPRIAVLSLNPHAGDGGVIGKEEEDIIAPAIEEASSKLRIMAFGPYAADGFFGNGDYGKFDGVLAMYHDQGLIPFKTIAMDSGVNFTSGLRYVRTSPDHGTAYDIAGKNMASPDSMRSAVYAAIDILRRRKSYLAAKSNPLRKQFVDRSGDKETIDLTKDDAEL